MKQLCCMLALTLITLIQQKCDLRSTTTDGIKSQSEQAVQPYFPNARTVMLPNAQRVLVFTCANGVSTRFVGMVAQDIASNPKIMERLRLLQFAPLAGANYQNLGLLFDGGIVWYEVGTQRVTSQGMSDAQLAEYRQVCGL